jgi:hypothetical protein
MEPAARLGAAIVWLLGHTWRIEEHNAPGYEEARARGEKFILAFWHARQLPLVYTHRGRGVVVLVSNHRDGELVARILERLGNRTARGSSTRQGEIGMRQMVMAAREGRWIAITPDGPRGPAERAKEGLTFLAARIGYRVVPLASSARASWVLRSWDRFRIPRPFTRVHIAHGEPLAVAPEESAATAESERARVEAALNALTAEVAVRSGERP